MESQRCLCHSNESASTVGQANALSAYEASSEFKLRQHMLHLKPERGGKASNRNPSLLLCIVTFMNLKSYFRYYAGVSNHWDLLSYLILKDKIIVNGRKD